MQESGIFFTYPPPSRGRERVGGIFCLTKFRDFVRWLYRIKKLYRSERKLDTHARQFILFGPQCQGWQKASHLGFLTPFEASQKLSGGGGGRGGGVGIGGNPWGWGRRISDPRPKAELLPLEGACLDGVGEGNLDFAGDGVIG
jgi:hypothetical protein